MSNPTYFVQNCPTCGRRLQVRVEYLGKQVVCQHCRGQFVAYDPDGKAVGGVAAAQSLLQRAEELLEHVAHPPILRPK